VISADFLLPFYLIKSLRERDGVDFKGKVAVWWGWQHKETWKIKCANAVL